MKNAVLLFCFVMITLPGILIAQVPQSFNYQAVVRDGTGNVVVNQPVSFQMSIYSDSITGTLVYTETHDVASNSFGLVTFAVGSGTVVTGDFATIDWGSASHFLKVEADITGGTTYVDMGTVQLISVPYALHSKTSEDAFSGNYGDLTGVPTNVSAFTNDAGYIISPDDADADPANELQSLSISGNDLTISGGNTVTMPQTIYTAGIGINVTGNTITNIQPDQTVSITGSGASTVTGTYPNFIVTSTDNNTIYSAGSGLNLTGTTFSNTAPDQIVTLAGIGATTVTGVYPNFTVSSTDNVDDADADPTNEIQTLSLAGNTLTLSGSNNVSLSGYVDTLWKSNGTKIYNSNTGNVGVGINDPNGKMVVQGDAILTDSDPLFEVKDRTGATVFVVYPDSVRIFVGDDASKTNKGAFAVSGRNTAKQITNDFLLVTPDSSRVYTGDTIAGFGVENIGTGSSTSYMKLTPNNYFIGHEAGSFITSGLYNSFIGFQAGKSDTSGSYNVFLGYRAGYSNDMGFNNTANGNYALYSNKSGFNNIANGNYALYYNTTGQNNIAIGNYALYYNTYGYNNTANGNYTLYSNTTGYENTANGYRALYSNTTGYENTANGKSSLSFNTTGVWNNASGLQALMSNTSGSFNNGFGNKTLIYNSTGSWNTAIGNSAGFGASAVNFNQCTFVGGASYPVVDRTNVTMLGYGIADAQCTDNNQVLLGNTAITEIRAQVTGITAYSDKRFKTNVSEDIAGLDFIMKLKPVTYNEDPAMLHKIWGTPDSLVRNIDHSQIRKQRFIGFLAQDVEVAAKECGFDFPGIDVPRNDKEVYSLRYSDFIMPMVKGMQELNAKNDKFAETIKEQQKMIEQLQKENEVLKERMNNLEITSKK